MVVVRKEGMKNDLAGWVMLQPHWGGKSAESKNSNVNLYQETSINNFKSRYPMAYPYINI